MQTYVSQVDASALQSTLQYQTTTSSSRRQHEYAAPQAAHTHAQRDEGSGNPLKRPPPPARRRESSGSLDGLEKRPPPPRIELNALKQRVTEEQPRPSAVLPVLALHLPAHQLQPTIVKIDPSVSSPESGNGMAESKAAGVQGQQVQGAFLAPVTLPTAPTQGQVVEGKQKDEKDNTGASLLERYREAARKAATGSTSRFASLALRPAGPVHPASGRPPHVQEPRPAMPTAPAPVQTRPQHPPPAPVPAVGAGLHAPVKVSLVPSEPPGKSGAALSQAAWDQIALLAELERQRQAFAKEMKERAQAVPVHAADTDLGHAAAFDGCVTGRSYFSPSLNKPPVRWLGRGEGGWTCPCEGCDVELVPQNMDAEEQAWARGDSGRHAVGFGASLPDAYHAFPATQAEQPHAHHHAQEKRIFQTKELWETVYSKPDHATTAAKGSLGPLGEPRPVYPKAAQGVVVPPQHKAGGGQAQPLLPASEVAAIVRRVVDANRGTCDAPTVIPNPMRYDASHVRQPLEKEEEVLPVPTYLPQVPSRAPPPRPPGQARTTTTTAHDSDRRARRSSVCSQASEGSVGSWATNSSMQPGDGQQAGRAEKVRQGAKAAAKAIGTRRNSLPVVIDASTGAPVHLPTMPTRCATSTTSTSGGWGGLQNPLGMPVDSRGKAPPAIAPHSLLQAMAAAGMSKEAEKFIIRAGGMGDTDVVQVPAPAPAPPAAPLPAMRSDARASRPSTTTSQRLVAPPAADGHQRKECLEARLAHIVKAANTVLQAHLAAKQKESMARLASGAQ